MLSYSFMMASKKTNFSCEASQGVFIELLTVLQRWRPTPRKHSKNLDIFKQFFSKWPFSFRVFDPVKLVLNSPKKTTQSKYTQRIYHNMFAPPFFCVWSQRDCFKKLVQKAAEKEIFASISFEKSRGFVCKTVQNLIITWFFSLNIKYFAYILKQ